MGANAVSRVYSMTTAQFRIASSLLVRLAPASPFKFPSFCLLANYMTSTQIKRRTLACRPLRLTLPLIGTLGLDNSVGTGTDAISGGSAPEWWGNSAGRNYKIAFSFGKWGMELREARGGRLLVRLIRSLPFPLFVQTDHSLLYLSPQLHPHCTPPPPTSPPLPTPAFPPKHHYPAFANSMLPLPRPSPPPTPEDPEEKIYS